ncbi:MAG: hypothetical protein IPP49_20275 [Saprospiraceae bacterium]|nr:hypothetical protein [Saprospiraceae bacterium]
MKAAIFLSRNMEYYKIKVKYNQTTSQSHLKFDFDSNLILFSSEISYWYKLLADETINKSFLTIRSYAG